MAWSAYQRKRLAFEKSAIDQLFPSFQVYQPTSDTYWKGTIVTNGGRHYVIRIEVPENYPEQPPRTYIVSPCPLYTYNGQKLTKWGTSHTMHTFTPKGDWAQMCLFREECWSSEYTIVKIIKKARIWLEAFDVHRRTGVNLCEIVGTQKR